MPRNDSHSYHCGIPPSSTTCDFISGLGQRGSRSTRGAGRRHRHPTGQPFPSATSPAHTALTPSTRRGHLFPLSVQRVVHASLSLLQRRRSTSTESSPKNVSVMLRCWISEGHLISPEWFTRANFLSMKYLTIHRPPGLQ